MNQMRHLKIISRAEIVSWVPTPTFSMINPYILCAVKESGYMMTKETGTWMHITMSHMSVTVTRMLSTKSPGNRGG